MYLIGSNNVDLTAILIADESMKRYQIKTLLLASYAYAYAYARAIVQSRDKFAAWFVLDEKQLSVVENIDD